MIGTIAREVRRPELGDLDRREAAVRDAPHPDRARAPRLGGEPLDGVVAVPRLVRRVLVEGDAARRSGPADVDAGRGRSRARRTTRRARRRRCAARCPCRTGSSRGGPGRRASPSAHRAARGSPTARRRRATGSGRPRRSRPSNGGWPAARSAVIGRESRARPGDAATRPSGAVRRCRRWTTAGPDGPWPATPGGSPTRTPGSPSGTTRSPGPTAPRDLRRRPLRESGGRRPRPGRRRPRLARRPAPLHARRLFLGDPRGRRARRRDGARRAPGASSARRPASRRRDVA